MSDSRTRAWTFIIYPESAPDDWLDILDRLHIEFVVSPLHDKDKNPEPEGPEFKKEHYHVVLYFTNVKSYNQVEEITKSVNGTIPIKVHNMRSMIRYLIHLDNPEKYQYNQADIICMGGINIKDLLALTTSENYEIIGQIREWVIDNHVYDYESLVNYVYQCRPEWVYTLNSCNTPIWRFMQSRYCKLRDSKSDK